jgi:hypothetical protein
MPDLADLAQMQNECLAAFALASRPAKGPEATGYCLNCGEPLAGPASRWCGVECRDDWARMNAASRQRGG